MVARTAPPPATVPFERQQGELNRNPGRPLPIATVQQMGRTAPARTAPVRVQDMSRVRRIQPTVGAGPQPGAPQANPAPRLSGQPNAQPPNVVRQPSAPVPSRQQPEQRVRAASPAQANRPQAQVAPKQPAQQVKQAPVERPEPASRPRGAKDKPDKNDEKN